LPRRVPAGLAESHARHRPPARTIAGPNEAEREGYVPNVVYSCGRLRHGRELIIPSAISDSATSFATVPLDELLAAME
jgi:predicted GH43/DUF377 family glycosyl hydrolase